MFQSSIKCVVGEKTVALLALILIPWVVFYSVIFGSRTFSNNHESIVLEAGDLYVDNMPVADPSAGSLQDEPWLFLIRDAVRNWEIPLVNRLNGMGALFQASLSTATLYPLNLILPFLSDDGPQFFDQFVVLHCSILLAGFYLLLCLYSRPSVAAFVASASVLSWLTFHIINAVHFRVFAWTPWLCWSAVLLARNNLRLKNYILFYVICFLSLSAGNPQESILGIFVACILFVFELTGGKTYSRATLFRFFVLLVCSLLSASPILYPYFIGVANGDVYSVATPSRSLQGVDWGWMLDWFFPRINGIGQHFLRNTEGLSDLQAGLSPLVVIGMILALKMTGEKAKGEKGGLVIVLFCIFMIGWLKVLHISIFNFVAELPILNGIRYAKYHSYLHVIAGIIAALGWEASFSKRVKETQTIGIVISYLLVFIGSLAALHYCDPEWNFNMEGANLSGAVVQVWLATFLLLIGITIFLVCERRFALGRGKNVIFKQWGFVALALAYSFAIRPSGYNRQKDYDTNYINGELQSADWTDLNWVNGISRADPGFFVSTPFVLEGLNVGDELHFEGSGTRKIIGIDGDKVWVDSSLNPMKDGYPHLIKGGKHIRESLQRFSELIKSNRTFTWIKPNSNIFYGQESLTLFDPIVNSRYRAFMRENFPLESEFFAYVPKVTQAIPKKTVDALRFAGVTLVSGYSFDANESLRYLGAGYYKLFGSLPRAFLAPEKVIANAERLYLDRNFEGALAELNAHLQKVEIEPLGYNAYNLQLPPTDNRKQLLVLTNAYQHGWFLNGDEAVTFCNLYMAWKAPLTQNAEIVFKQPGLKKGLVVMLLSFLTVVGMGLIDNKRRAIYPQ